MLGLKKMIVDMSAEVMNSPDFKNMKGAAAALLKTIEKIDENTRSALDRLDALEMKIDALNKKKVR